MIANDQELAERIGAVQERIRVAAETAGRRSDEILLVAVTKTVPAERIARAVALGVTDLGENRAAELLTKGAELAEHADVPGARWHFIGPLQRNKVAKVVGVASLIHSVDSIVLARSIGRHAEAAGIIQDVLLQINVSGESSKHGVPIARAEEFLVEAMAVTGMRARGFMTIPPANDAAAARAVFDCLRAFRDRVCSIDAGANALSMGMSDDFEIAIAHGATIVRVGSAIFGSRHPITSVHDIDGEGVLRLQQPSRGSGGRNDA